MVDPSGKLLYLVSRNHPVHHQLRITGDRHQRCLKLVRNIRRKFPADSLCLLELFHLFRDLVVLLIYTLQKRSQFLIADFSKRMFQIQCIDRLD